MLFRSGIDVIMFDPVGYGKNKQFYQYDRIEYTNQIQSVQTRTYKSKTIFGFSTTTAPALIAADRGLFDKVIIHSPSIRKDPKYYTKHDDVFSTSVDRLKTERIAKISDKLIPKPNRINGWEEKLITVIGKTEWKVPASVVYDINNYYPKHGKYGFNPINIKSFLSIIGEYDYEITTGGYELCKSIFPDMEEVIIPNSTHFSMWENNYEKTVNTIIEYCKR